MPSTETQLFDFRPFEAARLSVLAYARGFTLWHYHAPQMPLGTVASDGFLRDAADMLAAGDMVLVSAGDGGRVLYVTKHGQAVWVPPRFLDTSPLFLDANPAIVAAMAHVGLITGTMLMTLDGEKPVESLRVGARALTLASTERPIQPLSAIAVGPVPAVAGPILVRAGTVAEGMPIRDLVVAPDQALVMREDADDAIKLDFSKRRLIPVRDLANGATVTRIRAPRGARYYRPIVAGPDLLMADGICVGAAGPAAEPAVPLLEWGAAQPYRERLLARARAAGWADTDDPDLAVEVDGVRLAALRNGGPELAVLLPAGDGEVAIVSRVSVPDEFEPGSGDTRRLGVALAELALDGRRIALDSEAIGTGALPLEAGGADTWRWTDGRMVLNLPPRDGDSVLELRIHWGWRTYRAPPVSPEA